VTSRLVWFHYWSICIRVSWSGMELSELHRRMIDSRHAILLFTWSGPLSTLAAIAWNSMQATQISSHMGRKIVVLYRCATGIVGIAYQCGWGLFTGQASIALSSSCGLGHARAQSLGNVPFGSLHGIRVADTCRHGHVLVDSLGIYPTATASFAHGIFRSLDYHHEQCKWLAVSLSILLRHFQLNAVSQSGNEHRGPIRFLGHSNHLLYSIGDHYCTMPLESQSRRCSNDSKEARPRPRSTVQWSYFVYMGLALTSLVVSGCVGIPSSIT
jgi:hypothetical protein